MVAPYLDDQLLKSLHTTLQVFQDILLLNFATPCPNPLMPFFYPPNSSNSNLYLLFSPADPARADTAVRKIATHDAISDECLEEWVGKGRWAGDCLRLRVEEPKVDLVWTWVNGSDPLHRSARLAQPLPPDLRTASAAIREKQYREHDELRFSLRSAVAATKGWKRSTFHLVANSYALPSPPYQAQEKKNATRLGQVPQWLDLRKIGEEVPRFVVHHDADLFRLLPSSPNGEVSDAELAAWREASLPTFNSMAIESQLANLPASDVSENTVFVMDDNYILLPITTSTFYSPIHGPVLHLQPDRLIKPPEQPLKRPAGWSEWRGLETAASHLSLRFGLQSRPYLMHNARAIPLPLLHEASLAFPAAFSSTATSRFREQNFSSPETHTLWLATNFIIERHREALLWSWVVGKWGGQKGIITREEKKKMWLELGWESESRGEKNLKLEVRWPKRDSRLQVKDDLAKLGLPDSGPTNYAFVSSDGYPNTYLPLIHPAEQNGWPDLSSNLSSSANVCTVIRLECFNDDANDSELAVEMFKRIMVDKPTCGDCIISALVASSGPTSFSAFLPPQNSSPSFTRPLSSTRTPPHLPLSLSALLTFPYPPNPRLFSLRLIQRYSYVIGSTPIRFFGVRGAVNARLALGEMDKIYTDVVLLCVNDDLASTNPRLVQLLDVTMRSWMERRWPDKLGIERTEAGADWEMGEQCG